MNSRTVVFISTVKKMLFDNVKAYSFIPGLKTSFSANPSHCSAALPFFYLNIHYVDSPDCLLLFLFLVFFLFLHFLVVGSVR